MNETRVAGRVCLSLYVLTAIVLLDCGKLRADPKSFGAAEFQLAVKERGLGNLPLEAVLSPGAIPAESFEISGHRLVAGDSRGLMYGFLAAAEEVRRNGKLTALKESPRVAMRGIRYFLHNEDLEKEWYYSRAYWDEYFSMLARDRFNRFNLVFAHQTDYLAPPYPFWVDLPEFPKIHARQLSAGQRQKNLEMLQYISQAATDHGIDFTLGIWEQNIQSYRKPPMVPMTEGLTRENIGPYTYAALKKVLQLCPNIRSVQMRTNNESGIPNDDQVDFYGKYVFPAIRDAGRPVTLDLRGWGMAGGMLKISESAGITARLSSKYWAEDIGRPYQPAETYPGYSYLNFLTKRRNYQFYWELWALGSNRLLLWGSPDYVRRVVPTLSLGDAVGFEIDPPLAQKGFGNAPGKWGVFTEAQKQRMFWKWEFERYWLFYRLWGRLSYNPQTSDRAWMDEMTARFGAASGDVMRAYRTASEVVPEIVAVHLADPNMYIWPEVNPGGLVDSYRTVLPSDWRYVASIPEAVHNCLTRVGSAKQTAPQTAERFEAMGKQIDTALNLARPRVKHSPEWLSTEPDLEVLALMAHYHAQKQLAAYHLELFDRTRDERSLQLAKAEVQQGISIWRNLVKLTDGLYPETMSFGPDDKGDWKDKLPYVMHDLRSVEEREAIDKQLGKFTIGFDFGGPVSHQNSPNQYRADNYVLQNNVAPGFTAVDPSTSYDATRGYGWLANEPREASSIPLTPYLEVRAVAKDPKNLPHDVLFRDYIRGNGPQKFAINVDAGEYEAIFLHPDHSTAVVTLSAANGRLEVPFPAREWSISGLVIRRKAGGTVNSAAPEPRQWPRPEFHHDVPTQALVGKDLTLLLRVTGTTHAKKVRLYYRPLDQLAKFKMIEHAPSEAFVIPGNDIPSNYDLMYYFEVVNDGGTGWFQPNPLTETPYYVLKTASGN
jgi:hypothetical protein